MRLIEKVLQCDACGLHPQIYVMTVRAVDVLDAKHIVSPVGVFQRKFDGDIL